MKISKLILNKILTEPDFSRELSAELGVKQASIEMTARRALNSENLPLSLLREPAINFFIKKGYTREEIFEAEPLPAK